jgi:hypothetical protein
MYVHDSGCFAINVQTGFGEALPMFMKDDQLEKVLNYNPNQWDMK